MNLYQFLGLTVIPQPCSCCGFRAEPAILANNGTLNRNRFYCGRCFQLLKAIRPAQPPMNGGLS